MHIVSDEVMRGCVQNGYPHRFCEPDVVQAEKDATQCESMCQLAMALMPQQSCGTAQCCRMLLGLFFDQRRFGEAAMFGKVACAAAMTAVHQPGISQEVVAGVLAVLRQWQVRFNR